MEKRSAAVHPVLMIGIVVCLLTTASGQVIREFTVAAGPPVTRGDVVVLVNAEARSGSPFPKADPACVFSEGGASEIAVARLSAETLVIAFRDAAGAGRGTVVIGAAAGGSVVFGSRYQFSGAAASEISLAALSQTEFVIAWRDEGQGHGKAVVGSASGRSITLGWPATFNAGDTHAVSVERLSANACVVACQDAGNGGRGTLVVGAVSNRDVVFGQKRIFHDGPIQGAAADCLFENEFVVAYSYQGVDNEDRGAVKVGRVAGDAVELGSESVFSAEPVRGLSVAGLSATRFVVTFWELYTPPHEPSTRPPEGSITWRGTGALGEVSGSVILLDRFLCGGAGDVTALSETAFALAYVPTEIGLYASDPGYGTAAAGRVWQNTAVFGREMTFQTAMTASVSVAGLSAAEFALAYGDTTNLNRGTVVVSDMGGAVLGIATAGAGAGERVPVLCQGISEDHAGLSTGMTYYVQRDGRLTPEPGGIRVGVAISATELLLDIER